MGNTRSHSFDDTSVDLWWNTSATSEISAGATNDQNQDALKLNKSAMSTSTSEPTKQNSASEQRNNDKLDEFRQDLARKHEKRRQILAEKRKEMQDLRMELSQQKQENEKLRIALNKGAAAENRNNNAEDELFIEELKRENVEMKNKIMELRTELLRSETIGEKNNELRSSIAELQKELQSVNAEVVNFEKERMDYQTHVTALKDVVRVSKEMLKIRESQLNELRQKVSEIEASLAGREMNVLSDDLRQEYERQLRNIRNLRTLYEERQRADKRQKEELSSQLDDAKRDLEAANKKTSELETRIVELETDNSQKYDKINSLESNLGLSKAECRDLQAEMSIINQLFSHILLGFNNCQDIDLDKLIKLLEENHDLLQNIVVNEESNASSALPKVLLDLVTQINDGKKMTESKESEEGVIKSLSKQTGRLETIAEDNETQTLTQHHFNSAEQIVENLPKVWKVLIELLSHQSAPPVNVLTEAQGSENPCYKVVQTAEGPRLVLSVSQTFIRLKDLILEKKSLEKETSHLKQLNTHLEVRLQDQEKRLELVSTELSKTWHVVGKMQKQHQQLHTQEKILRYELAQKRKLLTELKEELEYCREKWLQAREKNTSTEIQWRQLRTEFASRKNTVPDDINNSVESGYSDERECSTTDDEEPGYETDVSECNQKVSSPETISEISEEASEKAVLNNDTDMRNQEEAGQDSQNLTQNTSTILNVIRTEISDIESDEPANEQTKCRSELAQRVTENTRQLLDEATTSSKEVLLHSQPQHQKTDYVQSDDEGDSIKLNAHVEPEATTETGLGGAESTCKRISAADDISNKRQTDSESSQNALSARDLRLKRLEEQTRQLLKKVTTTSNKSVEIDAKLTNLHEMYGESSQNSNSRTTATVSETNYPTDENQDEP